MRRTAMLGVVKFYRYVLLMIVFAINGQLVESLVKFTSHYNGSNVIGYLHSAVNFTWTFTGDLKVADWGTKRSNAIDIDQKLVAVDKSGQLPLVIPSLYSGRVNGSWDGETPGQITITLSSIKEEDDNKIFICRIASFNAFERKDHDIVQLTVVDPPKSEIVSPVSKVIGVEERSSASITCNASGIPSPSIRWMRQSSSGSVNEIVADNVKYQVTSGSGSSQLIIKDIAVDDKDYYICNSSTNYGFHSDKVFLGVMSLYRCNDSCPSTKQSATMDEPTTICCPICGFPPPEVTWKFPNGTIQKTGNTILPITPNSEGDFGNYTCSAKGLKKTVPDQGVITINLQIEKKMTVIKAEGNQTIGQGDKLKWDVVNGALQYICKINGPDIYPVAFLGNNETIDDGNMAGIEIPYSTLNLTNPEGKNEDVTVYIEILAMDESGVMGKTGQNITTVIKATATTPGVSFMLGVVLFMTSINLQ